MNYLDEAKKRFVNRLKKIRLDVESLKKEATDIKKVLEE